MLDDYAARLTEAGVGPERTRMVATSAARDVRNREVFVAGIRERLGIEPEVISGEREAALSSAGALSAPAVRAALSGDPVLVVDIGGGSTELVIGDLDGGVDRAVSLPIGSVRLTERFLHDSPPAADDLARAGTYVDGELDGCGLDLTSVRSAIGVAGTVVTLAWLAGAVPADPDRMPGALIPRAALDALAGRLAGWSADRIRQLPGMHPGRADVITAGALIAARIAARIPTTGLVVSVADILDGVALELISGPPARRDDRIPQVTYLAITVLGHDRPGHHRADRGGAGGGGDEPGGLVDDPAARSLRDDPDLRRATPTRTGSRRRSRRWPPTGR